MIEVDDVFEGRWATVKKIMGEKANEMKKQIIG